MNLFHENGHLTKEGLNALVTEQLDELQRLEVAEHLSFCDDCLVAYTVMLDNTKLLDPLLEIREPVLRRIRRKASRIIFNKYTTVAAAACLAVALWGSGIFSLPASTAPKQQPQTSQSEAAPQQSLGSRMNSAANYIAGGLNSLFGGQNRGGIEQQAPEEDTSKPKNPPGEKRDRPNRQGKDGKQEDDSSNNTSSDQA